MALSKNQKNQIKNLLIKKIQDKLKKYARESTSMPFLARLVQDYEKVAAYSFIHSIATTLGMSIYEDVSKIIAFENSEEAFTKMDIGGILSKEQKSVIGNIVRELRNKERTVNKDEEVKEILKASAVNGKPQKEGRIADFYIKRDGQEHYFEIKTVKPNIDVFTTSKTKILEWVARKRTSINTYVALPYNPYHPEPYNRFTEQGLLERGKEFLIAEEYWDFLGGEGTYNDLLAEFDKVGKEYKQDILEKIKQVAEKKMKY